MNKKPKRPKDTNKLAKFIMDIATGESILPENEPNTKNATAVALGRLGGKKGGAARAKILTSDQRSAIAKKAAGVRWKKESSSKKSS